MIAPVPLPLPQDVFLCHSGTDKEWVAELAARLEREEWNGRPLRVVFAPWDVRPGDNVVQRLGELLDTSRHVAVVLSPELIDSGWATMEWTAAAHGDPGGLHGKIIPIILRTEDLTGRRRLSIPPALRILNHLDFSRKSSYEREYSRLLAHLKNEPVGRGARRLPRVPPAERFPAEVGAVLSEPSRVTESVLSNVLPVIQYPTTVWSAATRLDDPAQVWRRITDPADRKLVPPYILREGRLFAFADLSSNPGPLSQCIASTGMAAHSVLAWRDDQGKWGWFLDLLHRVLFAKVRFVLNLRSDSEGAEERVFFGCAWENGVRSDRTHEVGAFNRTVAKRCERTDGSVFWIHQACRMRFESLGRGLYLRLVPAWLLTRDGEQPMGGPTVGPLSAKWAGRERNAAILRNVLFWGAVLGEGALEARMSTGAQEVRLHTTPTTTEVPVGVLGDVIGFRALGTDVDDLARAAKIALSSEGEDEGEDSGD